jgi:hypothetical protein
LETTFADQIDRMIGILTPKPTEMGIMIAPVSKEIKKVVQGGLGQLRGIILQII